MEAAFQKYVWIGAIALGVPAWISPARLAIAEDIRFLLRRAWLARRFAAPCGGAVFAVAFLGGLAWDRASAQQTQALQNLTPQQRQMVLPLIQRIERQGPPRQGGEISGYVQAAPPGNPGLREAALPGAQVIVGKPDGEAGRETVTRTDSQGHFRIPFRPPGSYSICATKDGFGTACAEVQVVNQSLALPGPLALKPAGMAVRGCVTLNDGSAAARTAISAHQSAGSAEVSAVNASGKIMAGPVSVNAAGCYVLPRVPFSQDVSVAVRYEQAAARQHVPAGPAGGAAVNVVLPNGPPKITSFSATLGGQGVTHVPPGSTVTATAGATSPENFPLHYKWADSNGAVLPGDQPSKEWHLPRTNSLNMLFVEVSDGHGGAARASLPIATRPGPPGAAQSQPPPAQGERQQPLAVPFRHPPLAGQPQPFIDPARFMQCSSPELCKAEATKYYKQLGVFDDGGNPAGSFINFKTWKAAWGFSNDPATPGTNETRAVYYNNGDLQFGRDMHCVALFGFSDPAVHFKTIDLNVCYVTNYRDALSSSPEAPAGSDPPAAIANAESNTDPIAAVAMVGITVQFPSGITVQFPSGSGWENIPYVYFVVFAPVSSSTDLVPQNAALLDSEGAKAVPGICMACHGGKYDPEKHDVARARFQPFDTPTFLYDKNNPQFSESAQSEAFRTLNIIARNVDTEGVHTVGTEPPLLPTVENLSSRTIRELIAGWYGYQKCSVETPGCKIDDKNHPFIPEGACTGPSEPATCGWKEASLPGLPPNFYQEEPRKFCRSCHIALPEINRLNVQNFDQFKLRAPLICGDIQNYKMPFAEVPYNSFWSDPVNPFSMSLFLQATGLRCDLPAPIPPVIGTIVGLEGRCLDVTGGDPAPGTPIILFDCHGGQNQRWTFNPKDRTIRPDDSPNHGFAGKCLEVAGANNANLTPIILSNCRPNPTHDNPQSWVFEPDHTIVGLGGRCLDVTGGDPAPGTPIILFDCHGGQNQRWTFKKIPDGSANQ